MDLRKIITSQYTAAFEMLKESIEKCPEAEWNNPLDANPTWKIAYHAIFIAHMYLHPDLKSFSPWQKHHDPESGVPFSQQDVLEFLTLVQEQVSEKVENMDMEAQSGFEWLPFGKLELHIYNIRHIQQHIGEIYERLGHRQNLELGWVSLSTGN